MAVPGLGGQRRVQRHEVRPVGRMEICMDDAEVPLSVELGERLA